MKRSREDMEEEEKKKEKEEQPSPSTPELPRIKEDGVFEFISARGRTGTHPPHIHGKIEVADDDKWIKLRLDDSENLEFWAEAYFEKKHLLDFLTAAVKK